MRASTSAPPTTRARCWSKYEELHSWALRIAWLGAATRLCGDTSTSSFMSFQVTYYMETYTSASIPAAVGFEVGMFAPS